MDLLDDDKDSCIIELQSVHFDNERVKSLFSNIWMRINQSDCLAINLCTLSEILEEVAIKEEDRHDEILGHAHYETEPRTVCRIHLNHKALTLSDKALSGLLVHELAHLAAIEAGYLWSVVEKGIPSNGRYILEEAITANSVVVYWGFEEELHVLSSESGTRFEVIWDLIKEWKDYDRSIKRKQGK